MVINVVKCLNFYSPAFVYRCLSINGNTSINVGRNYSKKSRDDENTSDNDKDAGKLLEESRRIAHISSPQGWISRLLRGPQTNPLLPSQSHSSLLSVSNHIYEIVTHDAKQGDFEIYLEIYGDYAKEMKKVVDGVELLGSWKVLYSKRNQAVHLWRYNNGYADVDRSIEVMNTASLKDLERRFSTLLIQQENVLTQPFGYWDEPKPRRSSHIYELRTYKLRPGTMIEWGNAWATGITYRREHNQDVGGFFTKVGFLYTVFHIWAYKNLVDRNDIRSRTWAKPGWDLTVAYTVPLIMSTESKIMVPTSISHLK